MVKDGVKQNPSGTTSQALNPFLQKHQDQVLGVLQGLDRVYSVVPALL